MNLVKPKELMQKYHKLSIQLFKQSISKTTIRAAASQIAQPKEAKKKDFLYPSFLTINDEKRVVTPKAPYRHINYTRPKDFGKNVLETVVGSKHNEE